MAKRGRPRKYRLGEIVQDKTEAPYVVVDHQVRAWKSEYRIIPLNNRYERYGRAVWVESHLLDPVGKKSNKASVRTYRANRMLEEEIGRDCKCECCIHTAMDGTAFNSMTGQILEDSEE